MNQQSAPLFQRLLGSSFMELPVSIRSLHDDRASKSFAGRCRIERGSGWLVALIAWVMSLPKSGDDLPVQIEIRSDNGCEVWARNFAGQPMHSTLSECNGQLEERLGPMCFRFALAAESQSIVWTLVAVKLLGLLPLPVSWFKGVLARESAAAGRYEFDVSASLPMVGLLIHYKGWLHVEP